MKDHVRGPKWWPFSSGVPEDVRGRLSWYKNDWVEGWNSGFRILAPSVYIFFASAIPALAFGEQIDRDTDGRLTAIQVLVATSAAGLMQAIIGGQPLLIVGVAEPIILLYTFMYDFVRDKPDVGPDLFLAWAAWACVWAGALQLIIVAAGACRYIFMFTRFCGETFGMLIAVLFLQQAIKGLVGEFRLATGTGAPTGVATQFEWRLVNGIWGVFLGFGLVLTALLTCQARKWRFGAGWLRSFLADYGVPLMVVVWSAIGYIISRSTPSGVPRRIQMPNTWDATGGWGAVARMAEVPGAYIAGALVPGVLIAVLFYFDHSVSSQLAQAEEFNLKKPSAYNYDLALLGIITAAFGLIGIPPVNGVLPQAPMHTRSLATLKKQIVRNALHKTAKEHEGKGRAAIVDAMVARGKRMDTLAVGALESLPEASQDAKMEDGTAGNGSGGGSTNTASSGDVPVEKAADTFDTERELDTLLPVEVKEQRVSGLLQSLLCAVCLGISPGIKLIPSAVLWAFFAYMAADSLPGSQFWDRVLLLFTDPKKRYVLLERGHSPYIETVPFHVIFWFTLLQALCVGGAYGITWAGVGGSAFVVFILLLVPFRQFVMPRLFKREHLRELDAAPYEEAPPVSAEEAHREAVEAGWERPESPENAATDRVIERELGPEDWDGRRVRRPLDRASVEARRRASMSASSPSASLHSGGGDSRRWL